MVSFAQNDTIANTTSQRSPNQFLSVSFAYLTSDYLCDGYLPGRPTEFEYANKGFPGALCISYKYKLTNKIYLGLTGTIEQENGDWLDNEIPGGNVFNLQTTVKGAFVRTCYTLGLDFRYDYIVSGMFRQYVVAGVGATYEFETDQYNPAFYELGYWNGVNTYGPMRRISNHAHPNAYIAPLGWSIGRKLNYFLEIGFGYRGIINTGLSYGFNTRPKKNER